jgi:predicted nucleic acid-binding protein
MMDTCLLDTNILLYLANAAAPEHAAAKASVTRMLASGDRLTVAPQVLFEFWSVATRPVSANGLGNATDFPVESGFTILTPVP